MTYLEARERFEATPQFSATCTLDRIRKLLECLGHPETNLKIIHVAGTNGKGSTSTMTARVLEEHGYKTGLFLSPYVVTFRERVSINGVPISEEDFSRLAEQVLAIADTFSDPPNFFEQMTALALLYFAKSGCDFVVLEVGMGGRLDATNAIPTPLVAAITPISLDHTKYLGNTTGEIAAEKCGIIKPGCIVVSSSAQPNDVMECIRQHCTELDVPLLTPQTATDISCTLETTKFSYLGTAYQLRLLGKHQVDNAATVLTILEALKLQGIPLCDETCKIGLQKASLPARLEILSKSPFCLLDGGHNPAGITTLFDFLDENRTHGKLITVFGCLKDKGYTEMCKTVAEKSEIVITTRCPSPRTCSDSDLASQMQNLCQHCDFPNPLVALQKALALASSEDLIVICGSLYLAGSVKQIYSELISTCYSPEK